MNSPDICWRPTASLHALMQRASVLSRIRQFFDEAGFLEVQTPCLGSETVIDAHLDPIAVPFIGNRHWYLQTSPEAAMKRIMAMGAEAIYQIGPVFRADEQGKLHNPEFTMLEWYRRDDGMSDAILFMEKLLQTVSPTTSLQVQTYRSLFREHLQIDPLDCPLPELHALVRHHVQDYQVDRRESRDDLLDLLMAFAVQPNLRGTKVITNYPLSQGALARASDEDPETAERFELFADGIEIANGYAELIDADQLEQRMESENRRRKNRGADELIGPNRLIAAMRDGLPPCSGVALGFDRLLMFVSMAKGIDEVIAFPIDHA